MARPLVGDRVKETTQTSGTGTLSLAGAATGFRSFAQEFSSGGKCYYLIVDDPTNTTQYEVGIGTFTAGTPNTLSRDTILESTSSNNAVSWDSSTKTVISTSNKLLLNAIADAVDSDLVTTGTSTAYTLASYRPTVGLYEGRFICFKLHTTCGASPTLNVDATGNKGLVDLNGTAISSGAMVGSAYYFAKYNSATSKWVVFSNFGLGAAAAKNLGADIVANANGDLTRTLSFNQKTDNYTAVAADNATALNFFLTSAAKTLTLNAASTYSNGFMLDVSNHAASTFALTISSTSAFYGNGLAGAASFVLKPGESCRISYQEATQFIVTSLVRKSSVVQGGFKNLKIATADGGTGPVVTADQIALQNAGGEAVLVSSVNVTAAIDTGSIATSTWYYVWVFYNPTTFAVSAKYSLSSTAPTAPSGSTYSARVGAVRTKSGSAVFLGSVQYGRRARYAASRVMTSGGAGNPTTPTWVSVDVSSFIPPTAAAITLFARTSGGVGDNIIAAPNNGYGSRDDTTNAPPINVGYASGGGGGNAYRSVLPVDFLIETTNTIYWAASSGANNNLYAYGWEDNL